MKQKNCVFTWRPVSNLELYQLVMDLSNSRSQDHYGFSNHLIKSMIHVILDPLVFIINQCLDQGEFPDSLKISKVIPVFKKGNTSIVSNYRPISMVPVLSKIIESVMLKQLIGYFEENELLYDDQFGFRPGRSTTMAMERVVDWILGKLEDKQIAMACAYDLTKAFDCLPHSVIIDKLTFYGVLGKESSLIKSYLSNRQQYVEIEGKSSSLRSVNSGVPQGSILGPFLFILTVNDMPASIPDKVVSYADDTTVLKVIKNNNFDTTELTKLMSNWFSANGLSLNTSKTETVIFRLNTNLNTSEPIKLLGFWLDGKLTWKRHTEEICKTLSKTLYLLRCLRQLLPANALLSAYYGFFHNHLNYGVLLWGNSAGAKKVFLLQKKALRIITSSASTEHCRPIFKKLRILTLASLFVLANIMFMFDKTDKMSTHKDIHAHNTRGNQNIVVPKSRLNTTTSSHIVMSVKLFNKLPSEIKTIKSIDTFKLKVKAILLEKTFILSRNTWIMNCFDF